ncbi:MULTISPECIES: WD40/YVTN/BNR-like repeat-containing protein [Streptomyces]|uniref:1,4-beta-glucanase n=2 Tax=Streptomyces TaxID=1883 RepID=A0A100Y988_9ACTN|nr:MULTISPECIES: sialidase family protein [Streptomyces]KUH39958.1 1,4-beta-glucanase [Streptomyces kanasensis]UUS29644.1 1,4-beta-glucanase [Streptomyces changanensis]
MCLSPLSRRSVLAGGAATAALAAVSVPAHAAPASPGAAPATAPTTGAASAAAGRAPYRWRTAVIGGTGFVTGVLFHPRVRGLAYARTDIGGAYRWDDRTARWTPLTDHLGWDDWNLLGVEAMAVDPAHPDRLYLALGTYTQPWSGNGAVLRSDDRGATWARTDLDVKLGANEDGRGTGERLLVDPRDPATLWLGTRHDGLLVSRDRGATWSSAPFPATPSPTGQGVTLLVAAGRTVYAGWGDGDGALYRTTAGGAWEAVPGRPDGPSARVPVRAAYDAGARALYVTYADAPGPNGQADGSVHRLDTASGTWTDVTPVRPGPGDTFGYGGAATDPRRPGTVVVSTNNRWGQVDTLFRSTDGGATWTSLKDSAVLDVTETPFLEWGGEGPKFGWWIQALALDPFDSRHIVFGTGATLYGTRDLRRWAPEVRGLEESSVRQLVSPPRGRAHLLSGLGDVGVMYHERLTASPSRGMAANPVFGTVTGLSLAPLRPEYVVRAGWGEGGNGAYSTDGGRTWAPFADQPAVAATAPGPIAAGADGRVLLWSFTHWDGTRHPTHRSTDGGAHWAEVATFPKGAVPVADPADPRRFYAYDTAAGTVYVSTDGGATFTAGATGLPAGDVQYRIAAAPGRRGDLWLSAKEHGLFRSTDGGRAFTRVAGCRASYALGFGKAAPRGGGYPAVFQTGTVGDVTGVYRSDDAGRGWVRINDDAHQWGWTGEVVTGDPRVHGRVYLGTNGRGVQYGDPV